jgi:LacI family transcriptional regulator
MPIVCAFTQLRQDQTVPNVTVDSERQGRLAGTHLLKVGCQRIARFHCHTPRQAGFLKALKDSNITPQGELMCPVNDFSYEEGLIAIHALVRSGVKFDGLSADSDAMASAAVHYLLRMGIPRDAMPKIVGIDDSPIAEHCAIPLTSVTSEIKERAKQVVKLLFDRGKRKRMESVVIQPKLVIRESTDPTRCAPYFKSETSEKAAGLR